MKEYLMGLLLEHGDRAFPFRASITGDLFAQARNSNYIEMRLLSKYDEQNLPYKLTAKALEYIKSND